MKTSTKRTLITYLITIGGTLALGALSSLFVSLGGVSFDTLNKPPLAPPAVLFPIVWSVLYAVMGWSMGTVWLKATPFERPAAVKIYLVALFFNLMWSCFFFTLGWLFFAFLWLLILIVLTIAMILIFYGISKPASLALLPYLAWLLFAGYLNLMFVALN